MNQQVAQRDCIRLSAVFGELEAAIANAPASISPAFLASIESLL